MGRDYVAQFLARRERYLRSVFLHNVTSTFLVNVALLLLAIANSAIIARWLGPAGKGALQLALLAPSLLNLLLGGGIGVANVYFAGARQLAVPQLTRNSVGFALLATLIGAIGVAIGIISGGYATLLPGVPLGIAALAMLAFPMGLLASYFTAILQGLQCIIQVNIINLLQGALTLVLTLVCVVGLRLNLFGGVLASLGAGFVMLVLVTGMVRREGGAFTPHWNGTVLRPTFAFGLRGYVGNVLQFFNYRLDVFIVNFFLGPAGVGIYGVAVALAELLWHLPHAVSFVIFPKASASTPEVMNRFTPRVFGITLGLTALGGLGLALVGKLLIRVIYTAAFDAAYVAMLALLPGVILLGGAKVLTNEIAGRGYPQYNSISSGLGLIVTVGLDLLLIPRFGILGAALASTAAYTTTFGAAIAFYRKVSRHTPPAGRVADGSMAR